MNGDALDRAVTDASAAMTFSDAVPVESGPAAAERYAIDLHEPVAGRLVLEVGREDARVLAQTAWGPAFSDSAEAVDLFLAEFLNVVAGRYLAEIEPEREPKIGFAGRADAACDEARCYDVGGAVLRIGVSQAA